MIRFYYNILLFIGVGFGESVLGNLVRILQTVGKLKAVDNLEVALLKGITKI